MFTFKNHKKKETERLFISYKGKPIYFSRTARKKGVSGILIKVHHDGRVRVLAPRQTSHTEVMTIVRHRAHWIASQLQAFKAKFPTTNPLLYVSGENHYYLGNQYPLQVRKNANMKQHASLSQGQLKIFVREESPDKVRSILHHWYRQQAKTQLTERIQILAHPLPWIKQPIPLSFRMMKRRWGSCSYDGKISFNTHLIKAPQECIDFVIMHELCHIAEHNHSKHFYQHLTQLMPDWKQAKKTLDNLAYIFLNNT